MQYSDTTTKLGVIQYMERYTGLGDGVISGDTDKLQEFTAYVNTTNRKLWHSIFASTNRWQYDDGSHTDLPTATADLSNGEGSIALPSDALTVKRVEIKDENGDWSLIKPTALENINMAIPEYNSEDNTPYQYRLVDETIVLYPAPNYTTTGGGIKIYFERGSVAFAYDDTTATVGIAGEYEDLVPLGGALEWLKINLPADARTARLNEEYVKLNNNMMDYYMKRFQDYRMQLKRKITNTYR